MIIRTASCEEMLALWGYDSLDTASPTAAYFYRNISSGNAVFWALDNGRAPLGELYVFLDVEDKDFADGKTTAYLCALRVQEEYRGRGHGSALINAALDDLRNRGFSAATIGVDIREDSNIKLYRRLGFHRKIKDCFLDPCALDENKKPELHPGFWLLCKEL